MQSCDWGVSRFLTSAFPREHIGRKVVQDRASVVFVPRARNIKRLVVLEVHKLFAASLLARHCKFFPIDALAIKCQYVTTPQTQSRRCPLAVHCHAPVLHRLIGLAAGELRKAFDDPEPLPCIPHLLAPPP